MCVWLTHAIVDPESQVRATPPGINQQVHLLPQHPLQHAMPICHQAPLRGDSSGVPACYDRLSSGTQPSVNNPDRHLSLAQTPLRLHLSSSLRKTRFGWLTHPHPPAAQTFWSRLWTSFRLCSLLLNGQGGVGLISCSLLVLHALVLLSSCRRPHSRTFKNPSPCF